MKGIAAGSALLPLTGMTSLIPEVMTHTTPDPPLQLIFFKTEPDEFAFLNVLGKAHYKFSDLGELLAIRV